MCLPDFERFEQISEDTPIIGYRFWKNPIKNSNILTSLNRDYEWNKNEGPHEVLDKDSGIYSNNNYNNYNYNYNHYNNYYYNYNNYNYNSNNPYYNYNNNYNYNHNYYYNNNYRIAGIIKQYGKVAIHKTGYRSEFAIVDSIFSIQKSNAKGPKEFMNWIDIFNKRIKDIAERYECKVITWQDFLEQKK